MRATRSNSKKSKANRVAIAGVAPMTKAVEQVEQVERIVIGHKLTTGASENLCSVYSFARCSETASWKIVINR